MRRFILFIACCLASAFAILAWASGAPLSGILSGAWALFSGADPLTVASLCAAGFALSSFLFGLFTGDNSWLDRLWSTLPVGFAWFYAWRGSFSPALLAAAVLVTVWGARLSWNFAQKGGFTGTEDYRWAILRGKIKNPLAWQLFNLSFISLFQTGILVLFTSPLARLVSLSGAAIPLPKALCFGSGCLVWALAILLEAKADRQQWEFQEAKRALREGRPCPERYRAEAESGFRSTGLFSLSRHPAYFGELLCWWALFLAVSGLAGSLADWTLAGPVALSCLFVGSIVFVEDISAGKYPAYREYQKRVSALIPWPRRKK